MKSYATFTEAYLDQLALVYTEPEYDQTPSEVKGAGQGKKVNISPCWERTNVQFRIENLNEDLPTTLSARRNALMLSYMERETALFDQGDENKAGDMGRLSKVWDRIKNPDGTINSNYGLLVYHIYDAGNQQHEPGQPLKNQWNWAKSRLIKYKETGQAILHFNRPMHQWTKNVDQPCTVFIQFIIRNNRLHVTSYMRSNDIVYGTPYNLSYFIKLTTRMVTELQETYPQLTVGHLTHNATSLHIYKKHERSVRAMLYGESACK